jgi:hypothetical protein
MSERREDFNPEVNDVPTDDRDEGSVGDPTLDEEPPSEEAVADPEPSSSGDPVEPGPEPS